MSDSASPHSPAAHGVLAGNLGKPIKLTELELDCVAAEAARAGQKIKAWVRLALTSDDPIFHVAVEGLSGHIEYRAAQSGHHIRLTKYETVLLVIHPDQTGDLWLDTAAVSLEARVKRAVEAGAPVFESEIADITAMIFPLVEINKSDRVVCIFREGWRFGLFFDFNPDNDFSIERMQHDLGALYRRLKHRDRYEAIADQAIFERLVDAGWFPFVEILDREFRELSRICQAGLEFDDVEAKLIAAFDAQRVERMFERWMAKPHFAGKQRVLKSALDNFAKDDPVSVLKIILTEIEGILSEAYRKVHGKGAKISKLLDFAVEAAEHKAGRPDTLLFPAAFAHYLKSHTFAHYDSVTRTGKASSRHAVGHGAADDDSYTQVRALQAILTLDQLAFYT